MEHPNHDTDRSAYRYQIVGAIRINALSIDTHESRIIYDGPACMVFPTGADGNVELPDLTPGISAFNITAESLSGIPVETFVAIVDHVGFYEAGTDGTLHLCFTYAKVPNLDTGADVATVEPLLAHIHICGDFIGLVFEGAIEDIFKLVTTKYRAVRHNGNIYHTVSMYQAMYHKIISSDGTAVIADTCIRGPACGYIIGSIKEIPVAVEYQDFRNQMSEYINRCYGRPIIIEEVTLR